MIHGDVEVNSTETESETDVGSLSFIDDDTTEPLYNEFFLMVSFASTVYFYYV